MIDPLEHMARRVEGDPRFLAPALAHYARGEGLDDRDLARALGCPPGDLAALRLCRMPASDPAGFRKDVDRLAARFGLSAGTLAEAVRRWQNLQQLRGGGCAGKFLAARDAPRPDEGGSPAGDAP